MKIRASAFSQPVSNNWQRFLRKCMGTQLIQLLENVWVIQGGANIGVIAHDGRCLVIDSGMDRDAGRDILNQVEKLNLMPTTLLVTHAHAVHFGGAHYLVRQTGLKVYATRVEASVMAGPILEPLYLFSGAQPPRELQHKFLLAKPCPVDIVLSGNEQLVDEVPVSVVSLPGHSVEQVGVAFDNTTVQSALSTLYRRGEISPIFQDNSLTWRRA